MAALKRFYATHNSTNVELAGDIAEKFERDVGTLNRMLERKYGADLSSVGWVEEVRGGGEGGDVDAAEAVDKMIAQEFMDAKEREAQLKIHQENMQKIAKMSKAEMQAAHQMLVNELSPEMIQLMTKRGVYSQCATFSPLGMLAVEKDSPSSAIS